ncbi:repA [Salmonella enterica subsp. enterica serovar Newport]
MRTQNVTTDGERKVRQNDLLALQERHEKELQEAKRNQKFTQVYPLGWKRLMELARKNPGAFGLYTYLAQHIDGSCGAVVADQTFLSKQLDVSTRTIRNWVSYLEANRALVKIPVAGRVCAYALNPHEVWKGYDNNKPNAAFLSKTLVNNDGEIKRRIMAMFSNSEKNVIQEEI